MADQRSFFSRIIPWIRTHPAAVIAVVFWAIVLLGVRQYMQANDLSFADMANQLSDLLRAHWYGVLIYIGVYLVRPLILFPASILTILGGSVFGLFPGAIYVLIAGTLSAVLPYAVGRWFASDSAAGSADENALQRFVKLLQRRPFQAVLIMRLIYLPYDAVSLLAGSLRISFPRFLLATGLGNLAGTLSFVGIGASLEGDLGAGEISLNPETLVFSVVILILSLAISRWLSRSQQGELPTTHEASEA